MSNQQPVTPEALFRFMCPYSTSTATTDPTGMREAGLDMASAVADIINRGRLGFVPIPAGVRLCNDETEGASSPVDVIMEVKRTPETREGGIETMENGWEYDATPYTRRAPTELSMIAFRLKGMGDTTPVGFVDQWPDEADEHRGGMADVDSLCGRILTSLGIDDDGPTPERMERWMRYIDAQLPKDYTVDQWARALPTWLQRDRYEVLKADGILEPDQRLDANRIRLNWTNSFWWEQMDALLNDPGESTDMEDDLWDEDEDELVGPPWCIGVIRDKSDLARAPWDEDDLEDSADMAAAADDAVLPAPDPATAVTSDPGDSPSGPDAD